MRYLYYINEYWFFVGFCFLLGYIFIIRKYHISGQRTALFGFVLLMVTMILTIIGADDIAKRVAEFVWILFTIAFIQEFYHFLKYENK